MNAGTHEDVSVLPLGRPVRRRIGRRLLALAVLAVACAGLVLHTSVRYYRVTSASMEPTLQVGERVAVDPGRRDPRVGDIVVFHPPAGAHPSNPVCGSTGEGWGYAQPCDLPTAQESRAIFIKRVVAGPRDTIAVVDGRAVRDGTPLDEPYVTACGDSERCNFRSAVEVPAGDYYVLGDSRGVSDDSRFWGPVPSSWILGIAVDCAAFDTICHTRR
jgi:signal peptidase I